MYVFPTVKAPLFTYSFWRKFQENSNQRKEFDFLKQITSYFMKNNLMFRKYFMKCLLNQNSTSEIFLPRCDPVDIQALEIHLGGVKFAKKKKLSQQVKLRRDVINFATQVSLW